MKQNEEMKKNLLQEIDGYFMQLVYLKDLISVEEDIDSHEEKMNCSPNFTLIVKCALSDSYMLALMKLYDKSEKAKTIPNLIRKCEENFFLFPSKDEALLKLKEFNTKLSENEDIKHAIETLRTRRDTFHVHNDKKYFGVKIQNDKTYLKKYHIWILRNFTEDVLNYICLQLSSQITRKTKYDKCDADLEHLL
ncbi:TPA: hypothetical protein ACG3I4_002393 [Clostridioides difficile]